MGASEEGVAQLDLNINTNQVSLLVTTPQWRRAVRDYAMLVCQVCKFSGELLAHKVYDHNGVDVKWRTRLDVVPKGFILTSTTSPHWDPNHEHKH